MGLKRDFNSQTSQTIVLLSIWVQGIDMYDKNLPMFIGETGTGCGLSNLNSFAKDIRYNTILPGKLDCSGKDWLICYKCKLVTFQQDTASITINTLHHTTAEVSSFIETVPKVAQKQLQKKQHNSVKRRKRVYQKGNAGVTSYDTDIGIGFWVTEKKPRVTFKMPEPEPPRYQAFMEATESSIYEKIKDVSSKRFTVKDRRVTRYDMMAMDYDAEKRTMSKQDWWDKLHEDPVARGPVGYFNQAINRAYKAIPIDAPDPKEWEASRDRGGSSKYRAWSQKHLKPKNTVNRDFKAEDLRAAIIKMMKDKTSTDEMETTKETTTNKPDSNEEEMSWGESIMGTVRVKQGVNKDHRSYVMNTSETLNKDARTPEIIWTYNPEILKDTAKSLRDKVINVRSTEGYKRKLYQETDRKEVMTEIERNQILNNVRRMIYDHEVESMASNWSNARVTANKRAKSNAMTLKKLNEIAKTLPQTRSNSVTPKQDNNSSKTEYIDKIQNNMAHKAVPREIISVPSKTRQENNSRTLDYKDTDTVQNMAYRYKAKPREISFPSKTEQKYNSRTAGYTKKVQNKSQKMTVKTVPPWGAPVTAETKMTRNKKLLNKVVSMAEMVLGQTGIKKNGTIKRTLQELYSELKEDEPILFDDAAA